MDFLDTYYSCPIFSVPRYVRGEFTNVFIAAAQSVGLKVEVLDARRSRCRIYSDDAEVTVQYCSFSVNSHERDLYSRNKYRVNQLAQELGIAVPPHMRIKSRNLLAGETHQSICDFAEQHFPVVVKIINGISGIHVYPNLRNQAELDTVLAKLQQARRPRLLIEKHVFGHNYRVTVCRDRIVELEYRVPAFVVGNGSDSLAELVEKKNRIRQACNLPLLTTEKYLQRLGRAPDWQHEWVPALNERVVLSELCNQSTGGDVEGMELDVAHEDYYRQATRLTRELGLTFTTVDFITPDITRSPQETGGVFNEIHARVSNNPSCATMDFDRCLRMPRRAMRILFDLPLDEELPYFPQ